MRHDYALEAPLGERLRAIGSTGADGAEWQAVMPLAHPVSVVKPIDDLGDFQDRQQLAAPLALYFGLAAEGLAASTGQGSAQIWTQDWWVVVAARHAGRSEQQSLLRDLAGPLRTRVRLGLSSWTPERAAWTPLEMVSPGAEPVYLVGYAEFPLRFRTRVRFESLQLRNRS